MPVNDLRSGRLDEVSQRSAALILEERQRPFDLAKGPLLRTKLLRLKDTEHLFLFTMHRIISDYWSVQLLRQEIGSLCVAYVQRQPSPLAEPRIQFADYASWERRLISEGFLTINWNFRKSNWEGFCEVPK